MASMGNFIKWVKDRRKQRDSAKQATDVPNLGRLPSLPEDDVPDDYGFRMKNHIYEEIAPEDVESDDEVFTNSETNFTFGASSDVDPYLVVPIVGQIPQDIDVNASGATSRAKRLDETYDHQTSLYNAIPPWIRSDMKVNSNKRHGIAVKNNTAPSSSDCSKSSSETHGKVSSRRRKQLEQRQSKEPKCGHEGCARDICNEELIDLYQSSSNAKTQHRHHSDSDFSCSEYDLNTTEMNDILSEKEEYEYYLFKAEKNFQLERELKQYIEESSSSEYGEYGECGSYTEQGVLITTPCTERQSTHACCKCRCNTAHEVRKSSTSTCCKCCDDNRRKELRQSRKSLTLKHALILVPKTPSSKVNKARSSNKQTNKSTSWCSLESLNSSNYSSSVSSGNSSEASIYSTAHATLSELYKMPKNIKQSRRQSSSSGLSQSGRQVSQSLPGRPTESDRLSCGVSVRRNSAESDIYGGVYASNSRPNRMLADVMKRNHDRQLFMM